MPEPLRLTCSRCQIGQMRETRLPYTVIEHNKLVSVPDMPARVCDVCGNRDFDREAVKRLYLMLGAARRRRRDATERPASPPPSSGERARRAPRPSRPKKP